MAISSKDFRKGDKSALTASTSRPRTQAATPLKSALLAKRQTFTKTNLTLPVSKKSIQVTLKNIAPTDVWVSPLNPRNQRLLSKDDPAIKKLRQVIRDESQRDPVLVRMNPGPSGEAYELIYGSRRRFVALLEHEKNPDFSLMANVGDVGDADAARLARAENEDRAGLSAFERGVDYQQQKETLFKSYDQAVMAEALNVSTSSLSEYLAIARIPEQYLQLLHSPASLTLKDGKKLLQYIDSTSPHVVALLVEEIMNSGERFDRFSELFLRLKKGSATKNAQQITLKKPAIFGSPTTKITAKLAVKRGKENEYRVDISGLDEEGKAKLGAFLEGLCR